MVVLLLYYVDTLKRELKSTNVCKLQASLNKKSVVIGHGCHAALNFGVKAKENQDKFLHYTSCMNSIKDSIRQYLLPVLVLVRQQNFLNY